MRWVTPLKKLRYGDKRVRPRFALFPTCVHSDDNSKTMVWLQVYYVIQEYQPPNYMADCDWETISTHESEPQAPSNDTNNKWGFLNERL